MTNVGNDRALDGCPVSTVGNDDLLRLLAKDYRQIFMGKGVLQVQGYCHECEKEVEYKTWGIFEKGGL